MKGQLPPLRYKYKRRYRVSRQARCYVSIQEILESSSSGSDDDDKLTSLSSERLTSHKLSDIHVCGADDDENTWMSQYMLFWSLVDAQADLKSFPSASNCVFSALFVDKTEFVMGYEDTLLHLQVRT